MKKLTGMVALLLAMLLFSGISFAENMGGLSIFGLGGEQPNDQPLEEMVTGVFQVTIDEDVPEVVQQLYGIATIIGQMSSSEVDLSINDLCSMLDELEIEYSQEEYEHDEYPSTLIYLSDYLCMLIESRKSDDSEKIDNIYSVSLQITVPVHSEDLPWLESISETILLYETKK